MESTEVIGRPGAGVRADPAVEGLVCIVAGQLAGLVWLGALMLVFAALLQRSAAVPLELIASALLREQELAPLTAWDAATALLASQLGPALFWSIFFSGLVVLVNARLSLNQALLLGAAAGLVAEIVDVYLLMPAFQADLHGVNLWAMNVPPLWDWLVHLLFGLALGFFYWVLRDPLRSRWVPPRDVP